VPLDRATAALRELGVRSVLLDVDAHVRLATLRAGTGLKLPACCVLLAAEQVRAAVATFDDRLAAAGGTAGARSRYVVICVRNRRLRMCG
jgi:hypothetical protein